MLPAARPLATHLPCVMLIGALLTAAPAASAQSTARDGFKGHGAALCIAAGELLAAQPGADAGIRDAVLAWRQILHVMAGTDDERQAAVDSARASLADGAAAGQGMMAARALWPSACETRDMQVRYISVHGDEDRVRLRLAEEPGTALEPGTVQRLNVSASCLVGAEVLSRSRPSRPLRDAYRAAGPRIPDAVALQAIRDRSRHEIQAAPGSTVGKELAVDYLRHVYNVAASGGAPQPFVNFVSQVLHERCRPAESR